MSKQVLSVCAVVVLVAAGVHAAPLSVRVADHDFTFDVPYWAAVNWGAVYNYNGAAADELYVDSRSAPDPNHYVGSYAYTGKLQTVPTAAQGNPYGDPPAPSPFLYPVASNDSGGALTFGGDLDLSMKFSHNDGPYVDANNGDRFDISLVGYEGHLTIIGRILNQVVPLTPLYPDPAASPPADDIVLLDINFTNVSLLARVNEDRIFLVEGRGKLETLLGYDVAANPELPDSAVTFFKFFAEDPDEQPNSRIFTNPDYQPSVDLANASDVSQFIGRISGEAAVPEPGTLALLGLGGVAIVAYRRRRRSA